MLTGLEILLDRMKTNPEEFLKDGDVPYEGEAFGGKWSDLLDYAWRVADDEERKALQDAKIAFYRDDFNERVFKRLAGEEVKEELSPYIVKQSSAQAIKNPILLVGGFGQAQVRQEGAAIGVDPSFWRNVVSAGKGKLWWAVERDGQITPTGEWRDVPVETEA